MGDVLLYATDEEWGRFLPLPQPYGEEDARRFVATQVLLNWHEHPSWAIEHQGSVLGGINMRLFLGGRIGEIGYSISRSHWRRGFATEAARAVVNSAFHSCPDLLKLRAMADFRNQASIRVLEKIPMQREGVLRLNQLTRDQLVDEVWFGLLRSEWIPD
ncbi:MAG: GNAT family N-acetyltransferase [Tildeniella torsiva UHER 1998/13D]|nr:GNAT family N-acetyltransferase [Tildeniella torsiva UHER 1998/13D]